MRTKQWTKEEKRVALELWRVGTSQAYIRARLQMPERTLRRLIAADRPSLLKVLWCDRMADSEYLRSLVESMPRRMAEVIEKGGNMTKY